MQVLIVVLNFLFIVNDVGAVINGYLADRSDFTYQVLLKMKENDDRRTICSGAIIDEFHVLTAWHCIEDIKLENINVVVGSVQFHDDPNAVAYTVSKIHLHESRSCEPHKTRCYDIAVLTIADMIVYKDDIIDEIPRPAQDPSPGTLCVFAGWGLTSTNAERPSDELRFGIARIRSRTTCLKSHPSAAEYEFCAKPRKRDQTAIYDGDSGTPLVCNGVLSGIMVRGTEQTTEPMVAVSVYQLREFIFKVLEADTCVEGQSSSDSNGTNDN